jgi:ABC-type transport system involved in multi-copper enzyme maturation permease subunit
MSAVAPAAPAPAERARDRGSAVAVATQMFGADFLKLRRKRSILIWALVLALAPILIYFVVAVIEHASNPYVAFPRPHGYRPAGGTGNFSDGLRVIALLFAPLAALLIGVEAGTGDASVGVFRDLVVTGRSRMALFASRVPAALALCFSIMLATYAVLLIGTFAFAGNLSTPGGSQILNGLGFLLLSTGMLCAVAVGFAALTNSKPGAIIALIAWQIVASPVLANISALGAARKGLLSQAIAHFSPVGTGNGGHGATVTLSGGLAVIVLVAWLVVFLGLGAWRTSRMDA